jgi:hypothetical protein
MHQILNFRYLGSNLPLLTPLGVTLERGGGVGKGLELPLKWLVAQWVPQPPILISYPFTKGRGTLL